VSESFDYVLVYGVLHHLPDPETSCHEIARVLKPGGVYFGNENNRTIFRTVFDALQRVIPIWHEEAGPEALLSGRRLGEWFAGTGVEIAAKCSVYLPPHLINLLGSDAGYRLLRFFDLAGQSLPFMRHNGGLILIRGKKNTL
jgi:SAM-dependent methyltransferase